MMDSTKYARGQVWFVIDNATPKEGVTWKSRPYVILSNDYINAFAKQVTAAPITSQEKKEMRSHVEFTSPDGLRTILLEQIRTISKNDIDNYMYTLGPEVMNRVDEGVRYSLSIMTTDQYLDDIESKLNQLINYSDVINSYTQASDNTDKFNELFSKIDQAYDAIVKISNKVANNAVPLSSKDTSNSPKIKAQTLIEESDSIKERKTNKWTIDRMIEYNNDYITQSPEYLSDKYHLTTQLSMDRRFKLNKKAIDKFYSMGM